jgi:hypothetical protein
LNKVAKVFIALVSAVVVIGAVAAIGLFTIIRSSDEPEVIPAQCKTDTPSIECVSKYPEPFIQSNVTLAGSFVSYRYVPDTGLYHEGWGQQTYEQGNDWRILYLWITMQDATGNKINSWLSTAGEIHPTLIYHLRSLKVGDPIEINGAVYYGTKIGCVSSNPRFNDCPVVGELRINSVDGISDYVLPWDIPTESRASWFLGEGLKDGFYSTYRINYTDTIYHPWNGSLPYQPGNYSTESKAYDITMNFSKFSSSVWTVVLGVSPYGDMKEKKFDCSIDTNLGSLNCSKQHMTTATKEMLDNTVFFYGRTANASNPQPLYPIMSGWGRLEKVDANIGFTFPVVFYDEEIMIGNEQVNSTVVGWVRVSETKWWIHDGYPFPIKADLYYNIGNASQRHYYLQLDSSLGVLPTGAQLS